LAKQPGEVVPYKILPPVIEAVKEVVLSRLRLFNGVGLVAQDAGLASATG
jgi:fructose-bisphosphate aldolase class II